MKRMLILFAILVIGVVSETLKVDLTVNIRPATHCASGSLYGITETLPENIDEMITPLHPNVFVNPAKVGRGHQHDIGDAFVVNERIAGTTGKVQILCSDMYTGYYAFDNMNHWLEMMGETIQAKKNAKTQNFDGYVIWNEPDISWKEDKPMSFYEFWKKTYDFIRENDPDGKIIGPAYSWYTEERMSGFLKYCMENKCVPDIICWHVGGNQMIVDPLVNYRALEKKLGLDPLPISINEYCSFEHSEEGCPGVNAPYIAKFERYGVTSAAITWWFTKLPGRLGSLLTANNEKGGGWWFYKWYGDMTGYMAKVSGPDERSDKVDGFACVDEEAKYSSLVFGGNSVGNCDVVFEKLPEFLGTKVNVLIERVVWQNKDTPVKGTDKISEEVKTLDGNGLTITVKIENKYYAYRIYLTPAEAATETSETEKKE